MLAIHPVADGNGRVARLLTTHELLNLGYAVARYVSLEQQIFETKNAYYASLAESQRGWHDAEHSIWPWVEYLIGALAETYEIFEARVAAARGDMAGNKQDRVRNYVLHQAPSEFKINDIRRAVPGISDPTIRLVLNELRADGHLANHGSGRAAVWTRLTNSGASKPVPALDTAEQTDPSSRDHKNDSNTNNGPKTRRAWILEQLRDRGRVRRADLVERFDVSKDTATRDLRDLRAEGAITFVGPAKGGAWHLADHAATTAS
jgi:Fic family protein